MSKLTNFAETVLGDLDDLDITFGNLTERMQVLKEKGREVAGRWNEHLSNQSKAIAEAEAAINRISNVPLPPK